MKSALTWIKDMTSPIKNNKSPKIVANKPAASIDDRHDKPGGLLAGIIERATKTGLGRKKLDPSTVEADVANNMEKISKNSGKLRLAFLGGGSFGTAMVNLAARNGCDTTIWVRDKRTVKSMAKLRMNKKYLPGYKL